MSRVLVVDDSQLMLQMLELQLSLLGISPVLVEDSQLVMDILSAQSFDLVILDLHMPHINGLTLLRKIQSSGMLSTLKVVILTADSSEEMLVNCFRAGAADYIAKPINNTVFGARISAVLREQELTKQLLLSNTRYGAIFNASSDAIVILDSSRKIIGVNVSAETMLGYKEDNLLGVDGHVFLARSSDSAIFSGTSPYVENYDALVEDSDGRSFPASISVRALGSAGDDALICLVRDESALKEAQDIYRDLYENSPCAHATICLANNTISRPNNSMTTLLGFCPSNVSQVTSNLSSQTGVSIEELLRRLMNGKNASDYVFLHRAENGCEKWLALSLYPMYKTEHSLRECRLTLTDITALKLEQIRSEMATKEAIKIRNYLDVILMNMPLGVGIMEEPDLRYFRINHSLANINGGSIDDHIGKRLLDVLPHAKKEIEPEIRQVLATGVPILNREFSICLPSSTQERRLVDWLIPIKGIEDGGSSAVLAVVMDVTELREAQESLGRAQKLESLGTLAGGIAHDFNNILAVMLGNIELATQVTSSDSPIGKYLERISKSGVRAENLVRQIVTFSSMDSSSFEPILFSSLIHDVLSNVCSANPNNVQVTSDINIIREKVMGDESQLYQVLDNLVSNAFHAMANKGGTLTILADIESTNGKPAIRVQVVDTGSGISQAIKARIFDPFFTTKKRGNGSGLGLSVVHRIVESHGGSIEFTSTENLGTSFTLRFPLFDNSLKNDMYVLEFDENSSNNLLEKLETHVLVAEDDPFVAELYNEILTAHGCEVTVVEDGREALSIFQSSDRHFDLLISDQLMPEMNGDELCKQVLEIRPEFPIVMITGYCEEFSKEQALDLGIRDYLYKPVRSSALIDVIQSNVAASSY